MLQDAKQQYFNSLSSSSSKKFWKTVKLLSKKEVSITTLNADDGITAITDEEKSSMLNYYFSRCWNRSQPPLSEYFIMTLRRSVTALIYSVLRMRS